VILAVYRIICLIMINLLLWKGHIARGTFLATKGTGNSYGSRIKVTNVWSSPPEYISRDIFHVTHKSTQVRVFK
jgi:hypothetical protein